MWTTRRFRIVLVWGVGVLILLISVAIAKSRCLSSDNFFAAGDPWATYLGSAVFFLIGFGHIAHDGLSLLFFRMGLEKEFQPIRLFEGESDRELTGLKKMFVGYLLSAICAGIGLWQWIIVNGCDVVIRTMQGIPA